MRTSRDAFHGSWRSCDTWILICSMARASAASWGDVVAGGAVVGAFEVTVMLIVGIGLVNAKLPGGFTYPPAFLTAQEWFNHSALAPHFYGLEPLTRVLFSVVLPSSISGYFTQLLGGH